VKFERLIPAASFSSLQVGEFVLNGPLAGCHKWRTHLPENWTCPISSKRKTSQFQSSTDVTENTSGALATYKLINYPHAYIWMLPTYIWTFVYSCTYVQTYIHTYECVFATLYGHHHELESYSELHTCICMYKWTFVYLCTHIWMSFCHNAKSTQYRNVVCLLFQLGPAFAYVSVPVKCDSSALHMYNVNAYTEPFFAKNLI
jgi:hypothetical protein